MLSFWVSGIDLVWHGFKEPVWFPYRYSFLASLFLLLLAARALLAARLRVWAFAAAGVLGALWLAGYTVTAGEEFSVLKLVMCGGLYFGALVCIWLLGAKRSAALLGTAGFCCLAAADMGVNSMLSLRKFESYSKSGFETFYDQGRQVVEALEQKDEGYYRLEKNFMRTLNDPMLLGYWGISHYSSTKASTAKPMLEQLGYVNYTTYGWGSTAVADSLLGIKYLYTDGSRPVPAPYQKLELGTELEVYENPYALPLAYVGSADALNVDVEESSNTFQLQNEMLRALVPGSADALLPAQDVTVDDQAKGLTVYFTAPVSGPCYLAVPDTGNFLPADVKLDGELLGEYFQGDSLGGVFPLGNLEAGQTVCLQLGVEDPAQYIDKLQIYSLDETALAGAVDQLKENAPTELTIREGGSIRVTAQGSKENNLLILPFAWEDEAHWTAERNGEPVPVEQVFEGMMGVRLEEGENQIQLTYHHPGTATGAAVSGLCLIAVLGWYAAERRKTQKNRGEAI